VEKTSDFSKFYGVSARTGGFEPVRTFSGQLGMVVDFSQFYADVLYGRPLIYVARSSTQGDSQNTFFN